MIWSVPAIIPITVETCLDKYIDYYSFSLATAHFELFSAVGIRMIVG